MLHDILWQQNVRLAEACLHHPFMRGLADGSLDSETFRRYVAQDAFFLNAFARAYAFAAARSPDMATFAQLCELLNGVLRELQLHAAFAKALKIDLDRVQPYPAVAVYTDFLLATAGQREPGETMAAMTPCMRLYGYLGNHLAETVFAGNPYQPWIATYSGPDFQFLVKQVESLLDSMAEDSVAVRDAYAHAMHCELDFFSAMLTHA
ncbi:TenA family protein [Polaromonas sp. AER18D-145]|uniref:TenA family protein n=1 Tax=Polaromonas sp. AER18D-145 TaxID=1977060 RepID=UPI000BBBA161|nr:TenA family protein [Polaromonas sp. AER18D-145]